MAKVISRWQIALEKFIARCPAGNRPSPFFRGRWPDAQGSRRFSRPFCSVHSAAEQNGLARCGRRCASGGDPLHRAGMDLAEQVLPKRAPLARLTAVFAAPLGGPRAGQALSAAPRTVLENASHPRGDASPLQEVCHGEEPQRRRPPLVSSRAVNGAADSPPKGGSAVVPGSCKGTSSSKKNSAGTIFAPVARAAGFKNCCLASGLYDGSERDYFF